MDAIRTVYSSMIRPGDSGIVYKHVYIADFLLNLLDGSRYREGIRDVAYDGHDVVGVDRLHRFIESFLATAEDVDFLCSGLGECGCEC
jgi:hypothetical protein